MSVFLLMRILDDPRYEGFAFKGNPSLLGHNDLHEDFLPETRSLSWTAPRLAHVWTPQSAAGRVRSTNDFPCVDLLIPAFSQRAVDALKDMLEPNGELLPLISDAGRFYAYNTTTIADVLDRKKSVITRFSNSDQDRRPMSVEEYQFKTHELAGLTIFHIPEDAGEVFVTDQFVNRVQSCGLRGFDFPKVWPLPAGADWRQLHKVQRKEQARAGLSGGQTVIGHSVIIILKQQSGKPTAGERKRIEGLMDELDKILFDRDSVAPAIGSLQGHDFVVGECRLFLSCPDADRLLRKIRSWLESFRWDGDVSVIKRYGEYTDPDAESRFVEIRRR